MVVLLFWEGWGVGLVVDEARSCWFVCVVVEGGWWEGEGEAGREEAADEEEAHIGLLDGGEGEVVCGFWSAGGMCVCVRAGGWRRVAAAVSMARVGSGGEGGGEGGGIVVVGAGRAGMLAEEKEKGRWRR